MEQKLRKTGIDIIGDAPWGTHFCQFYQTKEDLIDILVPYFKAGLENNEYCMWVTSEPLKLEEAKAALRKEVKNLDNYIKKGQIEILDYSQWYTKPGGFDVDKVLQGWIEKEKEASTRGFEGLRLTGNTFWLEKRDWKSFADYEAVVNSVIGKYRILVICSYSLDKCKAGEIIDVVSNHQFALIRRAGKWGIIESSERKKAEEELYESEQRYRSLTDDVLDSSKVGIIIFDKSFKIVWVNQALEYYFGLRREEVIGKDKRQLIREQIKDIFEEPETFAEKVLATYEKNIYIENFKCHILADSQREDRWLEHWSQPIHSGLFAGGRIEHYTDITESKKKEQELKNLSKFPSENPNPVLRVQKDGKILYGNDAALPVLAKWKKKVGGVVPAKWRRLIDKAFESEKAGSDGEEVDNKIFSFVVAPILDGGYANLYARDITEYKQAEAELKSAQEKLIETAHRAGMAEVAADVLHNVGNVLNSINVSTTVIKEKVSNSEVANLEKVASIINEHTDDLGTFLTEHPQGKNIPVYLTEVSKCLQNEQTDIISRLWALVDNVQHIKDIVSTQQSYAKVSGVEVQTSLSKLAEDAIQINSAGLERHGTQLIREFEELGDVEIDKQKLLQILVNLVSNAKYALSGSKREEKLLTIRIYKHGEDRFRIEVADNGVGISEDNLAKIFSYGFTTKKDGNGVGLHSSALAAKEMGGTLTVYSDGLGQGATFTLELPFKPVEVMK